MLSVSTEVTGEVSAGPVGMPGVMAVVMVVEEDSASVAEEAEERGAEGDVTTAAGSVKVTSGK